MKKKNPRVDELVVHVLANKFLWFVKECIKNVVDLGHNDSHPLFLPCIIMAISNAQHAAITNG